MRYRNEPNFTIPADGSIGGIIYRSQRTCKSWEWLAQAQQTLTGTLVVGLQTREHDRSVELPTPTASAATWVENLRTLGAETASINSSAVLRTSGFAHYSYYFDDVTIDAFHLPDLDSVKAVANEADEILGMDASSRIEFDPAYEWSIEDAVEARVSRNNRLISSLKNFGHDFLVHYTGTRLFHEGLDQTGLEVFSEYFDSTTFDATRPRYGGIDHDKDPRDWNPLERAANIADCEDELSMSIGKCVAEGRDPRARLSSDAAGYAKRFEAAYGDLGEMLENAATTIERRLPVYKQLWQSHAHQRQVQFIEQAREGVERLWTTAADWGVVGPSPRLPDANHRSLDASIGISA